MFSHNIDIEISMFSREFKVVYNFLTLPRKISKYCIISSNLSFNLFKQTLYTLRITYVITLFDQLFIFSLIPSLPLLSCHEDIYIISLKDQYLFISGVSKFLRKIISGVCTWMKHNINNSYTLRKWHVRTCFEDGSSMQIILFATRYCILKRVARLSLLQPVEIFIVEGIGTKEII